MSDDRNQSESICHAVAVLIPSVLHGADSSAGVVPYVRMGLVSAQPASDDCAPGSDTQLGLDEALALAAALETEADASTTIPVPIPEHDDPAAMHWLSDARARELASALRQAVTRLGDRPPPLVNDWQLGEVRALAGPGVGPCQVSVTVEGAVYDGELYRRIVLALHLIKGDCDLWSLTRDEAAWLARMLAAACVGVAGATNRNIGSLAAKRASHPWLAVAVRRTSAASPVTEIVIRFQDEMVSEGEGVGEITLRPDAAIRLSQLLGEAVRIEASAEPYVYQPPEPADILVARVACSRARPPSPSQA
jgi:hypothetical protein